ncbi:MAG: DUF1330 domain-containing protein [Gaiellaceae bacterium]
MIAQRLEIRDPERFQGYLDAVSPTIEAHGGRQACRAGNSPREASEAMR